MRWRNLGPVAVTLWLGACAGSGPARAPAEPGAVEPSTIALASPEPPPAPAQDAGAGPTSDPQPVATAPGPVAAVSSPPAPPGVDPPAAAAPTRPSTHNRRVCSAERWDGWEGTPACRQAARRQIDGADRRCQTDADCVLLGSSCEQHGVSSEAAARYRRWRPPCNPPNAGQCSGAQHAVCDHGCCIPAMPGFGTDALGQ